MSVAICDKFELGYLLSQGKAGTQLRCGGKYYIGFVDNLILFRMMKNLENPLRFDKVMVVSLVAYFFGTPCIYCFALRWFYNNFIRQFGLIS